MLARIPPGAFRRRTGFMAVAALLTGGLLIAGGQTPVDAATGSSARTQPSVDIAYKNSNPPKYPVDALRNREQGMVVLRVRVDAAGSVTKVDVDAAKTTASSAELQAAAVTAAEGWKFLPGQKNGKSVGGWITIPVIFSLEPTGTCPEGQAHAAKAPFQCEQVSSTAASP